MFVDVHEVAELVDWSLLFQVQYLNSSAVTDSLDTVNWCRAAHEPQQCGEAPVFLDSVPWDGRRRFLPGEILRQ